MQKSVTDRVKGRFWAIVVLIALALTAALPGALHLPVTDRDEARFAQATTQMIETGDFIDIRFQDEPRHKKPVGIHWLQAVSVSMTGDIEERDITDYRWPSIIAFVVAVLLTYATGCILLGHRAAFAGAALLSVTVLGATEAGIAKTDSVQLASIMMCFTALAALYEGRASRMAFLFWAGMGLGILTKGPITPLVVLAPIALMFVLDRRANWLIPLLDWRAILVGMVPVIAWIVAVQMRTDGEFLRTAIMGDLGPKVVGGHEGHGGFPGLHLLLSPILFWPGTLFLIAGLGIGLRSLFGAVDNVEKAGLRFITLALIPGWLLFEITPTKLVHYTLPLYPLLALLCGAAYVALMERRMPLIAKSVGVLLFSVFSGLFAFIAIMAPRIYGPDGVLVVTDLAVIASVAETLTTPERVFVIAAIVLPLLLPLMLWRAPSVLLGLLIIAGLSWHVAVRGVVAPGLEELWVSERLSERLQQLSLHPRQEMAADSIVVVSGFSEPSLVFLTDRSIVFTNPVRAAEIASEKIGRGAVIEARDRDMFEESLRKLGASVVEVGQVEGYNYSKGRPVRLTIFRTTQTMRPAAELR
jgi:4-amino-4-deoxy-L-arabinose transferase-like glycosyltransferase